MVVLSNLHLSFTDATLILDMLPLGTEIAIWSRNMCKRSWAVFAPILAIVCAGGCKSSARAPRITAGGATFVNPIMQKWSGEYRRLKGAEIDYVSKGSGYGIEQFTAKTIDFGCSDAPMKKEQVAAAQAKQGPVVHIPLIMGAVAVVYNLPEVSGQPLKMTGDVLADIFRKSITRWNDERIAALNPGVALPATDIVVVARAESSGTTNIFTEYLAKVSDTFRKEIGVSTKPKWPQGVTQQEQNDGIAGFVKNNPGTIGYVEVLFAKKNQLPTAQLRNRSGAWVGPEAIAVTAAAREAMQSKPQDEPYSLHDLTYSLTDASGAEAYPICGISYAVMYDKLPKDKGPAIVEFLTWAVTEGQKFAGELEYAPLPAELQSRARERLQQIKFD
jgi:phosphate transport system substrate-binding protein